MHIRKVGCIKAQSKAHTWTQHTQFQAHTRTLTHALAHERKSQKYNHVCTYIHNIHAYIHKISSDLLKRLVWHCPMNTWLTATTYFVHVHMHMQTIATDTTFPNCLSSFSATVPPTHERTQKLACMHTQACMYTHKHACMNTQACMHECTHKHAWMNTHANTHVCRQVSYRFSKLLELLLCHGVSLPENEVRVLPLLHAYIQRSAFRYQKRQKNKKFPSTKKRDIQTMYQSTNITLAHLRRCIKAQRSPWLI